ncbi:MAG: helix-turn-helix transcriptional regulator [Bacteroidetes bacterium]|nr:helix-turn-helix transcriptional regulator [Bacteroidota bacterium]
MNTNNYEFSIYEKLSPREVEVFNLIVSGKTCEEIAGILCINVETVKTHRKNIRNKIDVHSIREFMLFAERHKLRN